MMEIKVIAKFDESMQRDVVAELDKGINKSKLASQLGTSRGTIIRIEKQMRPIIEAELEIMSAEEEEEANDDRVDKIKRTPFMQLMFNW